MKSAISKAGMSHNDGTSGESWRLPYWTFLRACSFFHFLFFTEAALLFPKINAEVCLSAPVLRETADDPSKIINQRPRKPMTPVPHINVVARVLTVELQ